MANINMSELMKMLSKMDRKDLENGIAQASKFLKNTDSNNIVDEIKGKQDHNK